MDSLLLDEHSRNIIRLWLSGRERPGNISYVHWAKLKSGSTAILAYNELAEIVDAFGYRIIDLLRISLDTEIELERRKMTKKRRDWYLTTV